MSIPHLKAVTRTHTPFCLLLLSLRGRVEGDRLAEKKRKRERYGKEEDKVGTNPWEMVARMRQ